MGAIGNLIWFVCGGVFMGLGWWLAGLLALFLFSQRIFFSVVRNYSSDKTMRDS